MSPAEEIERVGVVGSGVMGTGVAEVCARSGVDVRVAVSGESAIVPGRRRLLASLDRAVRGGKLTEAERDAAAARVSFTADVGDLADRHLVVEAVREEVAVKLEVFAALDKVVEAPEAILASGTSSIPISSLARATQRPGQVIGMHFFNPVPVLALVELIGTLRTDERTLDRAESFVTGVLGKQAVRSPDRAGFVVNALLVPYLLAAIRMVESGFATAEAVDRGMTLGCSHPLGPLRTADLIGLDTLAAVASSLYEEFKEPHHAPPSLLLRMVDNGLLGKKSGRGFHTYA